VSDSTHWAEATFEGNRLRQHREFMALSFREKMIRVEQLGEVAALFRKEPAPTTDNTNR
jgi:hypothetical protein